MHERQATAAVEARALSHRYGRGAPVLRRIDLTVAPGELFGLIGANGGGKTTLLRIIAGLIAPESGSCRVFGAAAREARASVGYLAQGQSLYRHLTVTENLLFRARLYRLTQPHRAVDASLDRFGLTSCGRMRVDALSGGLARRASFAAALIHHPRLLLLDEPTAGLDVGARIALWQSVLELTLSGTTIVVSTHDLADAERFGRIAFLDGGAVRALGTVGAVIRATGAETLLLEGAAAWPVLRSILAMPGVAAAYPSGSALRVVLSSGCRRAKVTELATAQGLTALTVATTLDDAAHAMLAAANHTACAA